MALVNPLTRLTKKTRLWIAIGIFFTFFIAEIVTGFYTQSLALVADAFHVLFDLLSFAVALSAIVVSEKSQSPEGLSFGWQRAQLLGSFFNGTFQMALGLSISLLSIERFIHLEKVKDPRLVLIVAAAGLGCNIITGIFLGVHEHNHEPAKQIGAELTPHRDLGHRHHIKMPKPKTWFQQMFSHDHDHDHKHDRPNPMDYEHHRDHEHDHEHAHNVTDPEHGSADPHSHSHSHSHSHGHAHKGHDLGTTAVLIHLMGDAINNLGVIMVAAIIWKGKSEGRYYADPAISMGIGLMLILTAVRLVQRGGKILLLSEPIGVDIEDVRHDLEKVPGVLGVHELHIWRLNEEKSCATAHVVIEEDSLNEFKSIANIMNECLHAYGIHSVTLQPEAVVSSRYPEEEMPGGVRRMTSACEINCGSLCEEKSCCGTRS